jgi:DNA-directed RNA polymerase subunit RPC12/RpoP
LEVGDGEYERQLRLEEAGMSVRPVNPLVRCPRCSSRLISPTQADGCHDGVVVDRRCPECGHRDRVVTTAFAAAVWARHETRVASSLQALADALADGAPIEVSEISAG